MRDISIVGGNVKPVARCSTEGMADLHRAGRGRLPWRAAVTVRKCRGGLCPDLRRRFSGT